MTLQHIGQAAVKWASLFWQLEDQGFGGTITTARPLVVEVLTGDVVAMSALLACVWPHLSLAYCWWLRGKSGQSLLWRSSDSLPPHSTSQISQEKPEGTVPPPSAIR